MLDTVEMVVDIVEGTGAADEEAGPSREATMLSKLSIESSMGVEEEEEVAFQPNLPKALARSFGPSRLWDISRRTLETTKERLAMVSDCFMLLEVGAASAKGAKPAKRRAEVRKGIFGSGRDLVVKRM